MSSWEERQRLAKELAELVEDYQVRRHNADETARLDGNKRSPLMDGLRDQARARAREKQREIHELEEKVRNKKGKQGELLEGAPDEPEPEPEGEPQSELDFNKKKKRERKKKADKRQTKLNLERGMKAAAIVKAAHEAGKRVPQSWLDKLLKGLGKGARAIKVGPFLNPPAGYFDKRPNITKAKKRDKKRKV